MSNKLKWQFSKLCVTYIVEYNCQSLLVLNLSWTPSVEPSRRQTLTSSEYLFFYLVVHGTWTSACRDFATITTHLLESNMVDNGILSNNMKPPLLPNVTLHSKWWSYNFFHWPDSTPTCDLVAELDIIIKFDFYQIAGNWCGMPTDESYSSGYLILSHFVACLCSTVVTNIRQTCFRTFSFERPSVHCLYFYITFVSFSS